MRDRVISTFVNFGADVMAPGRIMQGNIATFRVGELGGGAITARVLDLVDALPYARGDRQRARLPVGKGGLRRDAVAGPSPT